MKKDKDNKGHFGGTVVELTQAFDDLNVSEVTFTHVMSSAISGDPLFGFDYFTSDPGFEGITSMPVPMTTKELITFLAGSITKMQSSGKVIRIADNERGVWDIRSETESGVGTLVVTRLVAVDHRQNYINYRVTGKIYPHAELVERKTATIH